MGIQKFFRFLFFGLFFFFFFGVMAPHSSTLAWKIHGRRSLVGCSPWGG